MDRTKELQDDLERTGVEKNLRDSGKSVKSRKGLVHKGGRRRRTLRDPLQNLQSKRNLTKLVVSIALRKVPFFNHFVRFARLLSSISTLRFRQMPLRSRRRDV